MADLTGMLMAASGSGGGQPDPNFNQTVLLLHGDGTNGAQNNTFLDSSTNNFTITRNGNTTQGTFSPFSVADGEWSNYFDGSGDGVSIATDSALDWGTTTDFTMECWFYSNVAISSNTVLFDTRDTGLSSTGVLLGINSSSNLVLVVLNNFDITGATSIEAGQWYHIAVVRNSGTFEVFIDGVSEGTSNTSRDIQNSDGITIGGKQLSATTFDSPTGYISNARVVSGTAVYTSAFTPPTAPLTDITNTSLLTCQSNRFVDNSSNAFAITVKGNTSVQPFSPFAPSAAYSASVNGGSGYFDGSGDYLSVANNSAFTITNNAFTLEAWVYPTAISGSYQSIAGVWNSSSGLQWIAQYNNSEVRIFIYNGGLTQFSGAATITANQWYYIVIQRDGSNSGSIYVNGTRIANSSYANTGSASTADLNIGRNGDNSEYVTGYISGFKFVKNTAVYSGASISVPTSPPTTSNSPAILTNFTNAGIFDNTGKNNLETVGNAQIDTTTKKYGTGSMEFDGTGDWLKVPNSVDIQLGTGDFTIEFWVYLATGDTGSNRGLVAKGGASTGWLVSLNTTEKVVFTYTTSTITSSGAITLDAWNHIAVVREGTGSNETKIYINGTNDGTGTVSTDFNQTEVMYIGANRAAGDPMKGYIDDLRITKGVARYTTTFTPPTAAFPDL